MVGTSNPGSSLVVTGSELPVDLTTPSPTSVGPIPASVFYDYVDQKANILSNDILGISNKTLSPSDIINIVLSNIPTTPTVVVKPTNAVSSSDLRDIISRLGMTPQDAGATDDNTDQMPYFNAAIERLAAANGGTLIVPPSKSAANRWRMESPLINLKQKVSVIGAAPRVEINDPRASGDAFIWGDASHPVYYSNLANFQHINNIRKSSGRSMNLRNCTSCVISEMAFENAVDGINAQQLNTVFFNRGHINFPYQTSNTGFFFHDDPNPNTGTRSDIILLEEWTVQGFNAGSYGLTLDGSVYGLQTRGFYALGCNRGLQLLNSAGRTDYNVPSFCTFDKFEVDRALNIGVYIDGAFHIVFRRPEISNTSGAMDSPYPQGKQDTHAFVVTNGTNGGSVPDTIIIKDGKIHNAQRSALVVRGKRVMVSGVYFEDVSKITIDTPATREPVVHVLSGATDYQITDCSMNGSGRASYPVVVESGATRGIIKDNIFSNTINPDVVNLATGTHIIKDNILSNQT
jgi:hypothetical protein